MLTNIVTTGRDTTLTTRSGARIDLKKPNVDHVTIEDIAHTLSHICRWNGIPENFFSVAEHCVMAAELAPPEHRLALLMHDCEESILGDNITPLKNMIPELVVLGDVIRKLIIQKFNVPYDDDVVQQYDKEQLDWEYGNIILRSYYYGLAPSDAKKLFIQKFKEYSLLIN